MRPAGAAQVTHPTEGYTVTYPDNWFANNRGPGPIVLENVPAEAYLHGGILPEGGANITIQVLPPETDEYAKLDQFAFGSQNVHRSSRLDHPPARLDHTFKLDSDIVYKSVSIAVRSGGKLFVLTLNYHAGDPKGSDYEQVLATAVSSLKPAQ